MPKLLWFLEKGKKAPITVHLAQSSGLVFPLNPQISDPTREKPNIFIIIIPVIEAYKYSTLDQLSPSHLDPYLPVPAKELLSIINGLFY